LESPFQGNSNIEPRNQISCTPFCDNSLELPLQDDSNGLSQNRVWQRTEEINFQEIYKKICLLFKAQKHDTLNIAITHCAKNAELKFEQTQINYKMGTTYL